MDVNQIQVIAPNLKKRLSGVTTTIVRLVPLQAKQFGVVATGPGLPEDIPYIPLWRLAFLPRRQWRVWHSRRNLEMLLGLFLRHVLRRRLKLLFTSAAQRDHSNYTKWLISKMDRIVATSPKSASFVQRPSTVIMHGINTDTFHPVQDKQALRDELGLPSGLLIGCFGRVRHQKGVDVLIDAALEVLPNYPDAQIIFTGRTTSEHEQFKQEQIDKLTAAGLADRVHFKGELDWESVVKYYQSVDLFIAPARTEGFGLTPLEAMACGVPVIATKAGAFEAQIDQSVTGRIVQQGEPAKLAEAMNEMLSDPTALIQSGKKARTRVEELFDIKREAASLIEVYKSMLET